MEFELSKKTLCAPYILLDTVSEQPVDADITLPDYCPDIERIVRCSIRPMIYMSNINGDRLTVEGGASIRIVYLESEKKRLSSFEYTVPFSESFTLRDSPECACVYTDAKPEYINCRALSPRKLSLHGAFSLYAKVAVKRQSSYSAHDSDDGLQTHHADISASELSGLCRDVFSVREDISMNGYPEAAVIVSHRMSVRATDVKALPRKLMLSGEALLELVYLSDRDGKEAESMSYSFPISHIVECEGADENSAVELSLDLMCYEIKSSDDGSGSISVDMKLSMNAMCFNERDISVIDDAFSTRSAVTAAFEPFSCRSRTRVLSFTAPLKSDIQLEGDRISKVISVAAERISATAALSGGAPLLSAKLSVNVMYINADGDTRSIDRDVEFNCNPSADGFDSVDSVTADIVSLSYRITGDSTIELRADAAFRMTVSACVSSPSLSSVTADDDAPPVEREGALILYFADKGESVWNIAKHFSSVPADIAGENDIDGDVLSEDSVLLIPNTI